jgi:hypothetical protein
MAQNGGNEKRDNEHGRRECTCDYEYHCFAYDVGSPVNDVDLVLYSLLHLVRCGLFFFRQRPSAIDRVSHSIVDSQYDQADCGNENYRAYRELKCGNECFCGWDHGAITIISELQKYTRCA